MPGPRKGRESLADSDKATRRFFELGVLVIAGGAAVTAANGSVVGSGARPKGVATSTPTPTPSPRATVIFTEILISSIKIDDVDAVRACAARGGEVVRSATNSGEGSCVRSTSRPRPGPTIVGTEAPGPSEVRVIDKHRDTQGIRATPTPTPRSNDYLKLQAAEGVRAAPTPSPTPTATPRRR